MNTDSGMETWHVWPVYGPISESGSGSEIRWRAPEGIVFRVPGIRLWPPILHILTQHRWPERIYKGKEGSQLPARFQKAGQPCTFCTAKNPLTHYQFRCSKIKTHLSFWRSEKDCHGRSLWDWVGDEKALQVRVIFQKADFHTLFRPV
jgi:hypothetical protein